MSRVDQRRPFTALVRMAWLENDMDEMDKAIQEIHNDIKGLSRVLVGMLVSMATASVLLAINLAVR